MEAILPFKTKDRKYFCQCALEIGFDEFFALKFIYIFQDSDLDVYQLMGNERLALLLYGWEVVDSSLENSTKTEPGENSGIVVVVKRLIYYTLDLMFSKEWEQLQPEHQIAMLYCLKRAKSFILKISELATLNWDYLLELGVNLWKIDYFNNFCENMSKPKENGRQSVEQHVEPASAQDIEFIKKEGLLLALLRLIKMFDTGSMPGVKYLSMRIIAAWNQCYEQRKKKLRSNLYPKVKAEEKNCLTVICHIYLMAIYESDDIVGFVIDNMMNNIRFYVQSMSDSCASGDEKEDFNKDKLEYTPARYIARTCVNLRMSAKNFLELFVFNKFDENPTTLFGIISQSYMSYVLGNLLMEINKMNEQDFTTNIKYFKRCLDLYVHERECSEQFMLAELRKVDAQEVSHNNNLTVKDITNFRSKMCKGNRQSNIGNYENVDDAEEDIVVSGSEDDEERDCERRIDPVFQNIPNYAGILRYVYNVLADRPYKGWHFAKLVLLLKIIGHELNVIETWRYHPGLSTSFMLGLEKQLAGHFEGLALIFQDIPFMEQEFWLTAFYLNPTQAYYGYVAACGRRITFSKRRNQTESVENVKPERTPRRREEKNALPSAKFELLSSTIEVQEIVGMTNHDTPNEDYTPLQTALRAIRLPERIIKDLLTVTFLPRNKSFAWAVNWSELRKRCKDLMTSDTYKNNLVQLNMAEANDRLKYLKIDYEKYKHRPQLDYGSIEAGYEGGNFAMDSNEEDDEEYQLFEEEDEDDDYKQLRAAPRRKTKQIENETRPNSLPNDYLMLTMRTRGRAGRVIETTVLREDSDSDEKLSKSTEVTKENVSQLLANLEIEQPKIETEDKDAIKTPLEQKLKDLPVEPTIYNNTTGGFKPFADIWSVQSKNIPAIPSSNALNILKNENLIQKFARLKALKLNSKPAALDESSAELQLKLEPKIEPDSEVSTSPFSGDMEQQNSYTLENSNLECTEAKTDGVDNKERLVKESVHKILPERNIISSSSFEKPLPVNRTNSRTIQREIDGDIGDTDSASDTSTTAMKDSLELYEFQMDDENEPSDNEIETETDNLSIVVTDNKVASDDASQEKKVDDTANLAEVVKFSRLLEENNSKTTKELDESAQLEYNNTLEEDKHTEAEVSQKLESVLSNEHVKQNSKPAICTEISIAPACKYNASEEILEDVEKSPLRITTNDVENAEVFPTELIIESIDESTEHKQTTEDELKKIMDKKESDECEKLKRECTETIVKVELRPLSVSEGLLLRQPCVRVKRMNMDVYNESIAKRQRLGAHCVYLINNEVSSGIGSMCRTKQVPPLKTKPTAVKSTAIQSRKYLVSKRRMSECSFESEEYKPTNRPKRRGKPPKSHQNMVAVPRSASGLKIRIASSNKTVKIENTSNMPLMDYIQINSSSSSSDEELYEHDNGNGIRICTVLSPVLDFFPTRSIHDDDPLYEEEMILCD